MSAWGRCFGGLNMRVVPACCCLGGLLGVMSCPGSWLDDILYLPLILCICDIRESAEAGREGGGKLYSSGAFPTPEATLVAGVAVEL